MKSRLLTPLLIFTLLLTTSTVSRGQTANSARPAAPAQDWQDLRDLEPGKKIWVEIKGSRGAIKGKLVSLVGSTMTLNAAGDTYILQQGDIHRVYQLTGSWSRGETARVWGVIGMLAVTFVVV